MKPAVVVLAMVLAALQFAVADDFKTVGGKEYKHAKVSRVEPDGIVITFSGGIVKIPFTELSAEIQKKYGYDPQAAATYSTQENEQQAALARQRQANAQQRFVERQKYWSEHPAPGSRQEPTHMAASTAVASVIGQTSTPEELENCYLEVRNVDSGLEIQRNWETSWGSYDRDHFNRIILNIRVGTVGNTGGPVKVQWFFVGRRLSNPQQRIVYGKGEKSVVVPPKYFAECYAAAPILKSHVLNLAARGERYVSGAQHDGWVVCIIDRQDRILTDRASSEELQKLFHDPLQFAGLPSQ
jgi:hypothetical protein